MFDNASKTIKASNTWRLNNINLLVNNSEYIDWTQQSVELRQGWISNAPAWIDDLKVGYATQVKIFRDNSLIYSGYESEFSDTTANDTTAPSKVSNITTEMTMVDTETSTRNLTINFSGSTDYGNTYSYRIQGISSNGETPLSEEEETIVISGVKGYSYVIDKSSSTIPDNTVDTTETKITKNITDSGTYYIHIKAIDNAGNVSSVVHHKIDIPVLTAQAKASENLVRLDWNLSDLTNKKFKVYQKKDGSNIFQTIGATDFNSTKQVKVLNVHPNVGGTITYTTWDGETITDTKSASLKRWMEEPNAENSKGYGKGIIEVTPVKFTDFNENPSNYLFKDSDGNWNYDVIFVGAWDCNGSCSLQGKFSTSTENYVSNFINDGYGFLAGHDFRSFRDNFVSTGGVGQGAISSDLIVVNKKGVMTNYPWELGDIGTILNIPYSHNNAIFTDGDIWFKYEEYTTPEHCKTWCNIATENEQGSSNHYLVTKNNLGMIQTGHSNGNATADEQKILANTLFFLNQLSTDNYLNDKSGQDVKAPIKPTLNKCIFNDNGEIEINFNESKDIGSKYKYYVESQDKNGEQITLSEVKEVEILSGLKGYSYVIDNNSNTIPDDTIEMTSIKTIKTKIDNSKEIYVHIKAIDNVGNSSETLHYKLTDMTKPTLELSLQPNSWTNGSVTINAKAKDNESGIKQIILPNGNIINNTVASYTVNSNGIYYFKAIDYMGNETISSITVSNIDKNNPKVTIQNNKNWTNQDVQVIITGTDN